jgi:flagellar assembly factor FliW
MPTINIKGKEFNYSDADVISFTEGLVGLPELRRAVLVPLPEFEPFCWLASADDEKTRFIVVNPHEIYADYRPHEFTSDAQPETATLAIVKVCSDWRKTTVNLRAPIFVDAGTKRGSQIVLSESPYRLSEEIPQTQ